MNKLAAALDSPHVLAPPAKRRMSAVERIQIDGRRFRTGDSTVVVQGVTYGPFAPNASGKQFPTMHRMQADLSQMRQAGINVIRVYHVPPPSLLDLAHEHGLHVLVDVPWRKHLCFLDSPEARREARHAVRQAAEACQRRSCVLAYSIGNEIPPDVLRWHGRRPVERFLAELRDVVKQVDPQALVTYANFPPTEYLDLSFLDFATFNVYLHNGEAFRRYLFRLMNLVGDKPLVLGEIGMDSLRHGEIEQAEFLSGHMAEVRLMGLAGGFVFSWTDDWYTGGYQIEDWAFGITRADRSPKPAFHAVREAFEGSSGELLCGELGSAPRVSVVVCTYNGGRTLRQCLSSLLNLDYPNYEVIVVDDGSTDDTPDILARFPKVRAIRQENQGLSVARNVGAQAATGSVIAYTDSDCFADPQWLTHLVYQLEKSGAAAVGGPNLTPEDGWLAACVAAAPGQPTHVLESDQEAEHIPGCNMAFRREALLAINGFDPLYRKAGDDVDVCWRLQHAGQWITFAPGAFVWHHRRQGPRAYLRQQAGYGEAEALLQSKHPEKFNGRGEGKWRGVLYGNSLQGVRLSEPIIYRGTYATGFFQCIYQPAQAHWAMLPTTLEWHAAAVLIATLGFLSPWLAAVAAGMLVLSAGVAVLQSAQARLSPEHDGWISRLVVCALCHAQPLVRSWARYRTRMLAPAAGRQQRFSSVQPCRAAPLGRGDLVYWTEEWRDRTELVAFVVRKLEALRWPTIVDSGWSEWDLKVLRDAWTALQICTVQEEHGSKKRLIRVRYRLRWRGFSKLGLTAGLILAGGIALVQANVALGIAIAVVVGSTAIWVRGIRRTADVLSVIEAAASEINLIRCPAACLAAREKREDAVKSSAVDLETR